MWCQFDGWPRELCGRYKKVLIWLRSKFWFLILMIFKGKPVATWFFFFLPSPQVFLDENNLKHWKIDSWCIQVMFEFICSLKDQLDAAKAEPHWGESSSSFITPFAYSWTTRSKTCFEFWIILCGAKSLNWWSLWVPSSTYPVLFGLEQTGCMFLLLCFLPLKNTN